jgi:hypothetical protein
MAEDQGLNWEGETDPDKLLEEIKKRALYMKASVVHEDGECYNLECPRCGCDKIVAESADLGTPAKCWECGHEFIITENCFKFEKTYDGWGEQDWGPPVGGEEW